MKRIFALILVAVMLLTLSACSTGPRGTETQAVLKDDELVFLFFDYDKKIITASREMFTITYEGEEVLNGGDTSAGGENVYRYEYNNDAITIFYPNGAIWSQTPTSTGAAISWDDTYDPQQYIEGDVMAQYLTNAYNAPREGVGGVGLFCLIIAAIGVAMLAAPEELIEMKYGWRFKNAEPTEFAVWEVRIGGIVVIVAAVVIFLIAAFA